MRSLDLGQDRIHQSRFVVISKLVGELMIDASHLLTMRDYSGFDGCWAILNFNNALGRYGSLLQQPQQDLCVVIFSDTPDQYRSGTQPRYVRRNVRRASGDMA